MIFESIKLAITSMWRNKLRTLLSLLGIMIGVASVVAILTIGDSVKRYISDSMQIGGMDMITLIPGEGEGSKVFNDRFPLALSSSVDGVEDVFPTTSHPAFVRSGEFDMGVTLYGVPSGYAEADKFEFESGGFFTSRDNINCTQVAVIGHDVAKTLFPDGCYVDRVVSIGTTRMKTFRVVGVLEKRDPAVMNSYNNAIYIPRNTWQFRFDRNEKVNTYAVKVSEGYDALKVGDMITERMDSLAGSDAYSLFSPATLVEMTNQVMGTISVFLAAIAAISLVVGGIGIMNIMLVSVAERTREIGIRKALGASPGVILQQFIIEAVTLTLAGGIIGIGLGMALSRQICLLQNWSFVLNSRAVVLSMGFSMVVGVFFGGYPAWKASRLDPVEALQYE